MAKHLTSIIWTTRLNFDEPYQEVKTYSKDRVTISFMPGKQQNGIGHVVLRKDAKLLAKRILQCLEHTK